jgi:uncharacterized protein YkwD
MRIHAILLLALSLVLGACGPPAGAPETEREIALEAAVLRNAADSLGLDLVVDPALRQAARDVALLTGAGFAGDVQEALRQAASEQGALDPIPFVVYGTTAQAWPAELLRRFEAGLASLPPRERRLCTHVAVGVVACRSRRFGILPHRTWSALLLVSQRAITFSRLPAEPQPGERFTFAGEVFPPFRSPEVLLTDPNGRVRVLDDLGGEQRAFRSYVHLDAGAGEYQLEVLGRDDMGPRVLGLGALHARSEGEPTPHAALIARARRGGPLPEDPQPPASTASSDPAREEARMMALVNRDRRRAGVAPLTADPQLAALARAHSEDMLAHSFFAHISPRTGPLAARAAAAHIPFRRIAENIALHRDVGEAEEALLRSPGHRANLVDPEFTRMGIGVAIAHDEDGTARVYVTQNFMVPSAALSPARIP